MAGILWTIALVLLIIWLAGLILDLLGTAIHVLPVLALLIIAWNIITGRRTA